MFITHPVLADTQEEARAMAERARTPDPAKVEFALAHLSAVTEIDFSTFDLDEPLGDLETNGHRTTLAQFLRYGRTPREAAMGWLTGNTHYVGTPDSVAERMGEDMAAVGGDGFLITGNIGRRFVGGITEGLVPALQRRGLVRTAYAHEHLRDNLREF
jgi:alkanesulfonate monooxygenase SsuD/methylene tetrahydromethanopterin reductase-like flavin-dependent oxidoreductase (luciferase family)